MSHHLMYSVLYAYYTQRMFSLRPMNTPDQAKRTDTGKRRSKPPEPICECENSVALNHLAILGGLGCSRIARNSANVCLKAVRRRGWGILLCARWIHAIASIPAHASSPVEHVRLRRF